MRFSFFMLALSALYALAAADGNNNVMATASPSPSPASNILPFDNLAQNLPEAFSALEDQFSDPEFRSMLTSQLSNPHAVEMFQSLIHDTSAVNSISSLLGDPKIQSSLSMQFVEQYLSPTGTQAMATSGSSTHMGEAFGDYSSPRGKNDVEGAFGTGKHSIAIKNDGATTKPRTLVIGCLLTILFSAIAPV
ncbi:hypothetical protein GGI04_004992 [Coemansia thaxteri]|uniref:Uncharacterized protein n=1 Tax=Coemansia thaxteri TaxID=2663907 RepID=A0A9W8BKK8_9FUNG|nr:hypothetical protein GGI04_004992 [Coemansia thaxteri]KAJ2008433.1 hypothetical protein H4R26_000210 [Coemansia thaxteri]